MSKSYFGRYAIPGGMEMNSEAYWQLFLKTGSPEVYLMYNEAKRLEQSHVPQYQGPGGSGHTLQ